MTGWHKSRLPILSPLNIKKTKNKITVILPGCVFLGQADVTQQITRSKAAGGSDDFSLRRMSLTVISLDLHILCDVRFKHTRQENCFTTNCSTLNIISTTVMATISIVTKLIYVLNKSSKQCHGMMPYTLWFCTHNGCYKYD